MMGKYTKQIIHFLNIHQVKDDLSLMVRRDQIFRPLFNRFAYRIIDVTGGHPDSDITEPDLAAGIYDFAQVK
jgi:hypothetical protein